MKFLKIIIIFFAALESAAKGRTSESIKSKAALKSALKTAFTSNNLTAALKYLDGFKNALINNTKAAQAAKKQRISIKKSKACMYCELQMRKNGRNKQHCTSYLKMKPQQCNQAHNSFRMSIF